MIRRQRKNLSIRSIGFAVAVFATQFASADDAALFASAKLSLIGKLHDPESAKISDQRLNIVDGRQVVCGRVNAKNRMGGYDGAKPFLWDPAISAGAIIYGGQAITDDPISNLARLKGFQDSCGS